MQILPALMLMVWMPSVGSAQQAQVVGAPDGLQRVGKEYHAKDIYVVCKGFAVWPSVSQELEENYWQVIRPEAANSDDFDTPRELIAFFRSLPKERTARGIFLASCLTHLDDPEASKAQMTDYQKTLVTNPRWVAARKKGVLDLVAACEEAKIDLWVNVNLGGKDLRFRKLTK